MIVMSRDEILRAVAEYFSRLKRIPNEFKIF